MSEPQRTCVVCRTSKRQADLVRIAVEGHGELLVGRAAPGRGAYVCRSPVCVQALSRRSSLSKALRVTVADGELDRIVAMLNVELESRVHDESVRPPGATTSRLSDPRPQRN